ncbi:MAG: putative toxin-antitoxin system toxin component, PIN family [Sphingobacteriales bacterium JAD_PAG50586_3]|nr:MAG: putative toxin-antitoxin system toxin component, PIN family [Sphingobacteriales bacterium JAD_PAG50586_3]
MSTINIEILNPKAQKLLNDLADLQLIRINSNDAKKDLLRFLESKRKVKPEISFDDVAKEVDAVRTKRYAKRKIRIIIDTNILISYLISKRLINLDKIFLADNISILFSKELIDELHEVIQRPKMRKYFSEEDALTILIKIVQLGEVYYPQAIANECADPKDNFLLDLASEGKADFLMTGDAELLALNKFNKTHIGTYNQFIEKYKL